MRNVYGIRRKHYTYLLKREADCIKQNSNRRRPSSKNAAFDIEREQKAGAKNSRAPQSRALQDIQRQARQASPSRQAQPSRQPPNARQVQPNRQPPQASGRQMFDQATAPIPRTQNGANGPKEMILPLTAPINGQSAPQSGKTQKKQRRGAAPAASQRRITRGEARRRRFRKRLVTFIVLLLAITAGVTLSVTFLFKIENFVFEGTGTYSQDDLLLAFGIPKEENIFSFKISEAEARMSELLPYTEEIKVRRRLPSTIVITATPAEETYYTDCPDGGYAILSAGMKVLRLSAEAPPDKPFIKGIEPVLPKAGARLEYPSEDKKNAVEKTLAALAEQRIDNYTELDVTNTLEISFLYDKRARILLGTSNDLSDKLALAGTVLREQIGPAEHGTLDVSHQSEDKGRQGVWTPGTP